MAIDFNKYIYSKTTHYISNCGQDERKQYHGGKAGDQTGKEYCLKAWYNRPWTVILRYPNPTVRMKIAMMAIEAALNNNIGYDQDDRLTFWKSLKAANYDIENIKTPCEADCTSSTSAIVKATGYLLGIPGLERVPNNCTSRNMRQQFTAAGFIPLTNEQYLKSPNYLVPGDILLYESHHAAINVTLGKSVPNDDVQDKVIITGKTVWVRTGPATTFDYIGIARKGETYDYLNEQSPNGSGWYKINYDGKEGWVSGKYSNII